MTTATISKDLCKILDTELRAAVEAIAAKHGLKVKTGGGKFSAASFTPRVEFLVVGEVEGANKKEEDSFKALAGIYGLQSEMLGKTFKVGGDSYRVLGLLPSRSKNCVSILRLRDGSKRICQPEMLLRGTFVDFTPATAAAAASV